MRTLQVGVRRRGGRFGARENARRKGDPEPKLTLWRIPGVSMLDGSPSRDGVGGTAVCGGDQVVPLKGRPGILLRRCSLSRRSAVRLKLLPIWELMESCRVAFGMLEPARLGEGGAFASSKLLACGVRTRGISNDGRSRGVKAIPRSEIDDGFIKICDHPDVRKLLGPDCTGGVVGVVILELR